MKSDNNNTVKTISMKCKQVRELCEVRDRCGI